MPCFPLHSDRHPPLPPPQILFLERPHCDRVLRQACRSLCSCARTPTRAPAICFRGLHSMSQKGSNTSVDSSSVVDITQRRTGITPTGSRDTTPYTYETSTRDYFHQPQKQAPLLPRHYATLQEHANSVMRSASAESPYDGSRRGSFAWGLQATHGSEVPHNRRNPVMPQRTDNTTPPILEELVRKMTGDTSSTRSSSLVQSDAVFSRPSTTRSSIAGIEIEGLSRSYTSSSISGLARSIVKKIPEISTNRSTIGQSSQKTSMKNTFELNDLSPAQSGKKARKLSFQLPSGLDLKSQPETLHDPSLAMEDARWSADKAALPGLLSDCSGLAARRQVKMNLTLPIGLPECSSTNVQAGADFINTNGLTPALPLSPRALPVRKGETYWSQIAELNPGKAVPIAGEASAPISVADMVAHDQLASELGVQSVMLPATLPLTTPMTERPPQAIRDRSYIGQTPTKGNRSGWLRTSELSFGSTPDAYWTPEPKEGMTEHEAYAQRELIELAKTSRSARRRRWPWDKSKASGSDEHGRVKDERVDNRRRISVSLFKRSNRLSETTDKGMKEGKSPRSLGVPWRRERPMNKPPLPSASLANMTVPPTFVPPGSEKVSTSPVFDSAREVRGKLAGFFFDTNGVPSARRRPKASSGGYWDSNAVLMSMNTDLGLTNDEEEEGPEGRPLPAMFHFGPVNDITSPFPSPGLSTGPDGHLINKGISASPSQDFSSSIGAQDSWFRMHYRDYSADEELLTTTALKEADERRKFEWLIPEHLPNSPLCPLHIKYVGPSKGLCYWHGRKSNGWGVEPGRDYINDPMRIGQGKSRGWERGKVEPPKEQKKVRSLKSLIDPS
ncbi:hypothetical protein OPT61_g5785 [Boeremia exigua]|uniref:Uncharacterized protein n=1 Tax=Boeremia exigua TaxID=749465 RepID=A0ACC2I939_9PLEO|nr:hypothetical protein OPT61_g5785 [Boeremia exigua]